MKKLTAAMADPGHSAALAGVADISKPKSFSSLPVGGDATPRVPTAIADQRAVELPTVR